MFIDSAQHVAPPLDGACPADAVAAVAAGKLLRAKVAVEASAAARGHVIVVEPRPFQVLSRAAASSRAEALFVSGDLANFL